MDSNDFLMTDGQLAHVNDLIRINAEAFAKAGEDPCDDVSVSFEFSPVGRSIYLRCGGGPVIQIIDD
jgi:hypothetical protein